MTKGKIGVLCIHYARSNFGGINYGERVRALRNPEDFGREREEKNNPLGITM